ncbi:dethiobiotin synthase [Desulfovibrio mangrovi]|uniref:dethiobiotin synthase n=1 Tax=Desulfovibrio mangrovi TaxID=2976983 RepID=UPI00224801CC|nr:dethiobiotin synthase [Desulfovibrio mangrovi]UZP66727.1 dethiobiotin synthase [Desulfovibrio mangrovi]
MNRNHFFVTGTDTGVGKTVVSLLLMRALFASGHTPFYFKPVQTGCRTVHDADSDALFVYGHCAQLADCDPARSVGLLYQAPKAPLFAARDAGTTVDTEALCAMLHDISNAHEHVVFEGAGGALVPITEHMFMTDLMAATDARTIVAARAGLGTINHTLLTLESLSRRNLDVAGVVMVQSPQAVTPEAMVVENIEAVERISGVPVLCVVPPLTDFMHDGEEAVQALGRALLTGGIRHP